MRETSFHLGTSFPVRSVMALSSHDAFRWSVDFICFQLSWTVSKVSLTCSSIRQRLLSWGFEGQRQGAIQIVVAFRALVTLKWPYAIRSRLIGQLRVW